eukprot:982959-Amphidinium_carterae.1
MEIVCNDSCLNCMPLYNRIEHALKATQDTLSIYIGSVNTCASVMMHHVSWADIKTKGVAENLQSYC